GPVDAELHEFALSGDLDLVELGCFGAQRDRADVDARLLSGKGQLGDDVCGEPDEPDAQHIAARPQARQAKPALLVGRGAGDEGGIHGITQLDGRRNERLVRLRIDDAPDDGSILRESRARRTHADHEREYHPAQGLDECSTRDHHNFRTASDTCGCDEPLPSYSAGSTLSLWPSGVFDCFFVMKCTSAL